MYTYVKSLRYIMWTGNVFTAYLSDDTKKVCHKGKDWEWYLGGKGKWDETPLSTFAEITALTVVCVGTIIGCRELTRYAEKHSDIYT